MTVVPFLAASPSVTCTFITDDGEGNGEWCGKLSRFVVSRSDGDTSYGAGGGTEETCEGHLADSVTGMVAGGVNVTAIVAVRWDNPEPSPRED